ESDCGIRTIQRRERRATLQRELRIELPSAKHEASHTFLLAEVRQLVNKVSRDPMRTIETRSRTIGAAIVRILRDSNLTGRYVEDLRHGIDERAVGVVQARGENAAQPPLQTGLQRMIDRRTGVCA